MLLVNSIEWWISLLETSNIVFGSRIKTIKPFIFLLCLIVLNLDVYSDSKTKLKLIFKALIIKLIVVII